MTTKENGWRKSSACGNSSCVEVDTSEAEDDYVWVRNSKSPQTSIPFDRDEWRAFVAGVKKGEFDLPEPPILESVRIELRYSDRTESVEVESGPTVIEGSVDWEIPAEDGPPDGMFRTYVPGRPVVRLNMVGGTLRGERRRRKDDRRG